MAEHSRAGQYSPVSMEAARLIARRPLRNPRLLAAYLALARQTSMHDEGGHGRNRVTGAGAKKIAEVVGCAWPRARGLEAALAEAGLILPAPKGLRAGWMNQARWIIAHAGDTDLPHALVDGHAGASGGLRRLLDSKEPDPVVLCAMLLLLECYARHDLEQWGGVDPSLLWRAWSWSAAPEGQSLQIKAQPDLTRAATGWMRDFLDAIGFDFEGEGKTLFWSAFRLLTGSGLLYEAVTLIDRDQVLTPVRLNDYHAATGSGEVALISAIPGVGYYINEASDRYGRAEACTFLWPWAFDRAALKGVWRLRFRCATPQTPRGLERDGRWIADARRQLEEQGALERV